MGRPEPETVTNAESATIQAAIDELAVGDPKRRQDARTMLAEVGEPAVALLLAALGACGPSDELLRHEILKVLGLIADPAAADAFVEHLEDKSSACRWAAAEGLVALGSAGLRRVLTELRRFPDTEWTARGLHHALNGLQRSGFVRQVSPVVKAFSSDIPEIDVPKAAIHALTWMKG